VHALIQDVRYGFRTLRKNPGVTLIAVLSLALGIGGNSTMFSVIHTLLLQPPAYQNLDRLVVIWGSSVAHGQGRSGIAGADVLDCRKQSRSFEYLELTDGWASPATLRVSGSPERVRRQFVSPNLFQALGVKPLVGRNFSEEEVHTGPGVMMMSYEFWQRRFGADPGMVGASFFLSVWRVIEEGRGQLSRYNIRINRLSPPYPFGAWLWRRSRSPGPVVRPRRPQSSVGERGV
jgi:hypothetical protein